MTSSVGSSGALRLELSRAMELNDFGRAFDLCHTMFRLDPTTSTASLVLRHLERMGEFVKARVPCRVAILRSFTIEPAISLFRAEALLMGIDAQVQVGEFNAYTQEVLDRKSFLYSSSPDVIILAIQTRDIAPELWHRFGELSADAVESSIQRVASEIENLILAIRTHSAARVLVHEFETPPWPSAGVLDRMSEVSQVNAIHRLNQATNAITRKHLNVYPLDVAALVGRVGHTRWYDDAKWLSMRLPYGSEGLVAMAREWVRYVAPMMGKVAKCVVVDLDNTLWGGVVGEDGAEGLKLGIEYPGAQFQELQRTLLDLYDRGILLAIASKNNPEDALPILESHPDMLLRPKHFSSMRINWNPKPQSLEEIAQELNIGVDALAFVDDNPVERSIVRSTLPHAVVIDLPSDPIEFARTVAMHPSVQRVSLSREDRQRSQLYVADRERAELRDASTSLEDFYRSLQMVVEWSVMTQASLERVAQLTQKTNQFNLTTRRRSEEELRVLSNERDAFVFSARVQDRYGDNGLVGVVIATLDGIVCEIDTMLMSCRVIGRTVETAMLALLAGEAHAHGAQRLQGWFLPTAKNAPARDFYSRHGFECIEGEANGASKWQLDLRQQTPKVPPWFQIIRDGDSSS